MTTSNCNLEKLRLYSFDICSGFNLTANKIRLRGQLVLIKILTQKVMALIAAFAVGFLWIHIGVFSAGKVLGSRRLLT